MKKSTLTALILTLLLWSCGNKSRQQVLQYSDFDTANKYYKADKNDSAYLLYNRFVNNAPRDSVFKRGQAYRYMSDILWTAGELYAAEEAGVEAVYILDSSEEKQRTELGHTYNLLGNIYHDLNQDDKAINNYGKAIYFLEKGDYMLEAMNGKAIALQNLKRYEEAIRIYDTIITLKPQSNELIARSIDNRAMTKWLLHPESSPLPGFWEALKIRLNSADSWGVNASYAHLSDYYYTHSKRDSALWYAHKMLAAARLNNNPPNVVMAMDKLVNLSNTVPEKQYWYSAYRTLDDSIRFARDTTRQRYAAIRFDYQKNKADNLILKDENRKQRLTMYALIILGLLIIAGIRTWYIKRKRRMREESETAIRDARLKTSQKVHDVVANGLYRIMNELEHGTTIDKEPLINKIDDLYEKSRDISYEGNTYRNDETYARHIQHLLAGFDNKQTHVQVTGNEQGFWNKISGRQKNELELVLNELMINMKKHSQAKNVLISFKEEGNNTFINYRDDGIGLQPGQQWGNGLNNTVNRIKGLNGNITFGKSREGGVHILISLPLQSEII